MMTIPAIVTVLAALWSVNALSTSTTTNNDNKHAVKFERMIAELRLPAATVACIDSPTQRVLFRGVAAGVAEPLVKNAFGIVYQDLAPVRIAGDLLFSQLSAVAVDAAERASGVAAVVATAVDDDDERGKDALLATSRKLFDLLDEDRSGGLDRDELLASPAMLALITDDDKDNDNDKDDGAAVDRFLAAADENGDGVISFVEFANAAATRPQMRSVDEAFTAALESSAASPPDQRRRGVFGRKSPEDRFDAMLQACLVWEEQLGCAPVDTTTTEELCAVDVALEVERDDDEEDGRLLQVLKGSLVGARCEPVVEALKMCYLEYSPLRLGGDIIFKLLKRVVANQIAKQG